LGIPFGLLLWIPAVAQSDGLIVKKGATTVSAATWTSVSGKEEETLGGKAR
jgi:hypothetical protein